MKGNESKFIEFIVSQKEISLRKWFSHVFCNLPQSILFLSIRKKDIRVNGSAANLTANYNLKMHDVVLVYRGIVHKNNTAPSKGSSKEMQLKKRDLKEGDAQEDGFNRESIEKSVEKIANSLKVIYENEDFIVIDKPYGIASQLGTQVKFSIIEVMEILCKSRVYPVHRLDKNTTGVMIFGKNYDFAVKMADMLLENAVYKEYRLLVHGKFPDHLVLKTKIGRIYGKHGDKMIVVEGAQNKTKNNIKNNTNTDAKSNVKSNLRGNTQSNTQNNRQINIENIKDACTEFNLINCFSKNGKCYSEVKAILHTGRKHQIRVHCDYIGHGIVGDEKYNNVRCDMYYVDSFDNSDDTTDSGEYKGYESEGPVSKSVNMSMNSSYDSVVFSDSYKHLNTREFHKNFRGSNDFKHSKYPNSAPHASRKNQGNDNTFVRCRNCKCGDRMMLHCFKISFEDFNFTSDIEF